MKTAVVLISGNGSNLQALIDAISAGELPLNIAKVISNKPNAKGLRRACKHHIDHKCINHRDFESRLAFDQALIEEIDQHQADVVILAGFMRLLTSELVNHYKNKIINIHPSLLPDYPGMNTHQRVLDAKEKWHGATVHFVIPEVDAGPAILQGRLRINKDDTAEQLQQRVHHIEHAIYPLAIKWFATDRLSVVDAKTLLDGKESPEQLQTFDI